MTKTSSCLTRWGKMGFLIGHDGVVLTQLRNVCCLSFYPLNPLSCDVFMVAGAIFDI